MDDSDKELLSELDLGSVPTATFMGRVARPANVEFSRDLTEADIAALALPRGVVAKSLVRIHSSHHSLARCLAAGMKPAQAALVTGYDAARISVLQADSAFSALVADYRIEAKSVFADLAERMNDMSLDAIEMLHERLHENPAEFSIPMLLDVVKTFADRTGHGPNQDVSLKISTDFVDRPPRESFEEWSERRAKELNIAPEEPKKLN